MGISLRGMTALVTGASSGIGRATALALAAEGVRLLMCARDAAKLPTEAECKAAGAAEVFGFACDVSSRESLEAALTELPSEWKAVDVLVNNAGKARGLAKLWEDDPANWDEMIDTNVKGLLWMTKAFMPGMVERGRGHVVNIGSTAGYWPYANAAVYCGTKAAEMAITEALKLDATGTPVRVTSVDPGMVETQFSEVRFGGDKEKAAKVYQGLKPLDAEDIADAIVWAVTRPLHVNIHNILLTPTDQGNSTTFNRK